MNRLISYLRKSRTIRLVLAVLVVFSFLALGAHHHEADHGHDCSVCHAVQALALKAAGILFFIWIASVLPQRFVFSSPVLVPLRRRGRIAPNRAPPFSA